MDYFDYSSERSLIAAMLESEESLIEVAATLQTEDFYEPRHRIMYDILTGLYARSIKPTYLEMLKEGHKLGTLNKIEDRDYAKQTLGFHVSAASLPYWLKNVKDKARLRKLKKSLMKLAEDMKSPDVDVDKLLQDAEREIIGLAVDNAEKIEDGATLTETGKKIIEERMKHKGELQGITTGIGKLNRYTGGWKDGDLIIISAESGKGKTAFAQNCIARGCFIHVSPTLYINSEMSREQVILRFASIVSGISNDKIKFGEIIEKEKQQIFDSMSIIETAPFYHYPSPSLNLQKIISSIRKYYIQKKIKLVIIDYIGRIDRTDKNAKEWEEVYQIVKSLKTLAGELKIAIMILAQLNEDGSLQVAKRMRNEADIMIKLQNMSKDEMEESRQKGYKMNANYWVYLDKNRDGQGEVMIPVLFQRETLSVIDVMNL